MMRKAVLIVDDSRFARLTLRGIVTGAFPEWFVGEAANGADAIVMLDDVKADFVLLDYNMPGEDGLTVAGRIRSRQPEAMIALVTANVQDTIARQAGELGLAFIRKPVDPAMVLDFLRRG